LNEPRRPRLNAEMIVGAISVLEKAAERRAHFLELLMRGDGSVDDRERIEEQKLRIEETWREVDRLREKLRAMTEGGGRSNEVLHAVPPAKEHEPPREFKFHPDPTPGGHGYISEQERR